MSIDSSQTNNPAQSARLPKDWEPGNRLRLQCTRTTIDTTIDKDEIKKKIEYYRESISQIGKKFNIENTKNTDDSHRIFEFIIRCQLNSLLYIGSKFENNRIDSVRRLGKLVESQSIFIPDTPIWGFIESESISVESKVIAFLIIIGFNYRNHIETHPNEIEEIASNYIEKTESRKIIQVQYELLAYFTSYGTTLFKKIGTDQGKTAFEANNIIVAAKSAIAELNVTKKGHDRAHNDAIERMNAAVNQLSIEHKLDPASERWRKSEIHSYIVSTIGLVAFLASGVAIAIFFFSFIDSYFLEQRTFNIPKLVSTRDVLGSFPWFTPLLISVPAIFAIWLLKHFSRIFVQGFKLANDARYRRALTLVYSEIAAEGSLTDKQKEMVFSAMFKPNDSSPSGDDIDPNLLAGLIKMAQTQN